MKTSTGSIIGAAAEHAISPASRLAGLARACRRSRAVHYVAVSVLLLIPCFWQSRIQAGDLSSHVYNAWLSSLIEQGKVEGLTIVNQWTNVLFDLVLAWLLKALGAGAAQRIAVSTAVLIFAWGAFAFLSAVSHQRPWFMMPCVAMLAYGWVFQTGLFNFYLSVGFCLWALAILWRGTFSSLLAALPLLCLAWLAQALPVAWAVGATAYFWAARKVGPGFRIFLFLAGVAALAAIRSFVIAKFPTYWEIYQSFLVTGADQLWIFGIRYFALSVALLLLWIILFVRLLEDRSLRQIVLEPPFQLCLLAAAGVLLIPTRIDLPGFNHALVGLAERMSLVAGVSVCSLLAAARPNRVERAGLCILGAVFFVGLYSDTRNLNTLEDKMEAAVRRLQPYQRVVSAVCYPSGRINPVTHIVDRVCIGSCFSYANYEPPSAAFRVRSLPGNPVVVSSYGDSWALQTGTYVVKKGDLPLYQIYTCKADSSELCTRSLYAGETAGAACF